jgi:NAD(P)-dependent dehydrogenase (short-subunit alcohol dehydrogenase family)
MIPRVALVTGAARGRGAEIAGTLARDGHAVAVNDLPGSAAGEAVAERLRADGAAAAFFGADVTDEVSVRGLVHAVQEWQGPVDVLVCNATGPQPRVPRLRRRPVRHGGAGGGQRRSHDRLADPADPVSAGSAGGTPSASPAPGGRRGC